MFQKCFFSGLSILLFVVCGSFHAADDLLLVKDGRTTYRIVYGSHSSPKELKAASVLQQYLRQIAGVQVEIIPDSLPESQHEIVLGQSNRKGVPDISELKQDGFRIKTSAKRLFIAGKGERGTLYGVYAFLEEYLDCRMYSSKLKVIPKNQNISIPQTDLIQNPRFALRSVYYPDPEQDEEYLDWHKLHRIEREWGLWGHTFDDLLPASEYFDTHPEYYAEVKGRRQPSQLCLSNAGSEALLIKRLAEKINDDKGKRYWSVSQNDGSGYCECSKCKALNEKYGSPQGSLLRLVNRVAARFPDKVITTLAYGYSRTPPKGIRPAKNVSILLSNIEVNRSKAIAEDTRSVSFQRDFSDWKKLTNNIIIWDYVVQFTHYISPFPNLHTLKPNIEYFSAGNAEGVFAQGSVEEQGEFSELRAYLLAKLLWNPQMDIEPVKQDFLTAYYGKAAKAVGDYIHTTHRELNKSGARLDIYGNPITAHKSWLSPQLLTSYREMLENGLTSVEDSSPEYLRVLALKNSLDYARLQQARFFGIQEHGVFKVAGMQWQTDPVLARDLQQFKQNLSRAGTTVLSESGNTPEQYFKEWDEILTTGPRLHLALNKPVKALSKFYRDHNTSGIRMLTDGSAGYSDLSYNWLEWNGTDMEVLIDLEQVMPVNSISVTFLEHQRHLMFFPREVVFELSADGMSFRQVGRQINAAPSANPEVRKKTNQIVFKNPRQARFVKLKAKNLGKIPAWSKRQHGRVSILADEVEVR